MYYVYDDEPFDQAVWLANPDPKADDLVRARMVDSIIEKLKKPHSKEEVMQLLGEGQGPIERFDAGPGFMLTYHLGTYSDKYRDMGILVIDFGPDGKSEVAWHLQSEPPTFLNLVR
ncbi:MAG TPA: hypothetical protein PKA27_15725 [Fimbriimonadaceae bacterium]|nr:hypothetical protein [Fimbriimonadaceae bacterium]